MLPTLTRAIASVLAPLALATVFSACVLLGLGVAPLWLVAVFAALLPVALIALAVIDRGAL